MNLLIILALLLSDIPYHGEPVPEPTITLPPEQPDVYRGNPDPEPITVKLYETPFGCPKLGDSHKINGYYYQDPEYNGQCWQPIYYWNPGVPTYEMQFLEMPDVVIGQAWGGSNMKGCARDKAVSIRGRDMVAVPFCSEIGHEVWIKRPYIETIKGTGEWEGPFVVVDCAGHLDLYNIVVHRQEVVEIDIPTAARWTMIKDLPNCTDWECGMVKWDMRKWPEDVILSKIDPALLPEDYEPVRLADWFANRAEFFRTQEEWDNAYKPLFKSIDGIPSWRFEPNGQWITFKEH